MNQSVAPGETQRSIAPLLAQRPEGGAYRRPAEVETTLAALLGLSTGELVERCRINDSKNPGFVPSECVLYFVRRLRDQDEALRELFAVLRQRVLHAVPVAARRVAGSTKLAEKAGDLEIQDIVLQKFQELLCKDRGEYHERLDCFECRFNFALARLRSTARRKVWRDESHYETTDFTEIADGHPKEIESALAAMRDSLNDRGLDFLYRSKLHAAINSLPPDQRRVVELIFQGVRLGPREEGAFTIANIVGCAEKTVRNRRDRAFETLREALKEEEIV